MIPESARDESDPPVARGLPPPVDNRKSLPWVRDGAAMVAPKFRRTSLRQNNIRSSASAPIIIR